MVEFSNGKPNRSDRYYCEKDKKAIAKQTNDNWISLLITIIIMCGFGGLFYWTSKNFGFIVNNSMLVGAVILILWIIAIVISGINAFKKNAVNNKSDNYNFEILLSVIGFAMYTVFIYVNYLHRKETDKTKSWLSSILIK